MEIENHKEEVPFAHYEVLFRALNPQEVLSRLPDTQWDGAEFTLRLLGREFAIAHPSYAIRALDGGAVPPLPTQTFLLRYLLEGKNIKWNGNGKPSGKCPGGKCTSSPILAVCSPAPHSPLAPG